MYLKPNGIRVTRLDVDRVGDSRKMLRSIT